MSEEKTLNAKEKRHLAYKKQRAKQFREIGKPANLEQSRRFKNENPGANRKNWVNWSGSDWNRQYRQKYFECYNRAKKAGYRSYFNLKVYIQWVEAGADENSPLLLLDAKDFPPQRRKYD